MHKSRDELEPMIAGDDEGHRVDAGEPYHLRPYHPRPGHFVQAVKPVELIELSPADEHDQTMPTIARNLGLVA